ncbi:diacylglycerol acyltransferase [Nitzschia inconspicua]|uniref:Acyltransferase n=1 Tax=Nitzschia inconspicua TaxID=303405 RepID=A0A9K3PZ79_9STRA|nr:diacylglycerol acyltransferase [Nitzschia inconspicua]
MVLSRLSKQDTPVGTDDCDRGDTNPKKVDANFVDFCSLSMTQIHTMADGTDEDRQQPCRAIDTVTKDEVLKVQPMTFWEELLTVMFLAFVVPNGVFTIPPLVFLIGKFVVGSVSKTFLVFGLMLVPLAILPQPYKPATLQSWMAVQVCRYFSFRFIYEEQPPPVPASDSKIEYHPRIMVAPPHGVFPYGNILSMIVFPSIFGQTFRGLASSAALRPPVFKQVLRSIGVIDASRNVARKALERNESLGISTGGVAEVFETNEDDECVLLKERVGLIKLAIRTGADIVPCYVFGNTKLLGCWAGEGIPKGRYLLERISRKLGFALILVYGRFLLPVPWRKPVLGVMGKGIPTHQIQCEDPTAEQIETIQTILLEEMEALFDRYKHLYGWEDKKLIIK